MTDGSTAGPSEPREFQFLVRGQVLYRRGLPIPGVIVRAYDKDLRRESLLGETLTNAHGNYEVYYSEEDLARSEKRAADLVVRVWTREGDDEQLLAESAVIFSAGRIEKVRLHVDGGPEKTWSEYEQLMVEMVPLVGDTPLTDLVQRDDQREISLLAGQTGQDPRRIATLVVAHKLASRTGLAPEVCYGLARQGLPTNLSRLLATSPDVQRHALNAAIRERIIPDRFATLVDEVVRQLGEATVRHALSRAGTRARPSFGDLLVTALPGEEQREEFVASYLAHTGTMVTFWEGLRDDPQLSASIDDIQHTIQYSALAGGHLPLVQELQRMRSAGQLSRTRDLAGFQPADWTEVLSRLDGEQPFPTDTPGATEQERLDAYAATLTKIVQDALPTATLAFRATADEQLPGELRTFWRNVTTAEDGFDLGHVQVRSYLAEHPELLQGVADTEPVLRRLERTQRLYNLTPRHGEIEALDSAGLGSSAAITRLGRDVFVQRFAAILENEQRAGAVHDKAALVAGASVNLLASFSPAFDGTQLRVLPDLQAIPNITTLFGSLGRCACEHCRSLTSPAAYLAELLAFLAERVQTGSGATNARDVLLERRPDLGELELTCTNTDTPLPYVDLVNEILEAAVAPFTEFELPAAAASELDTRTISQVTRDAFATRNHPLGVTHVPVVIEPGRRWLLTDHSRLYVVRRDAESAPVRVTMATNQTGHSAGELAATPQHVNTAAYETLRAAIFPWSLPLDQWRDEVVTYLGHLGVERHRLMGEFSAQGSWSRLDELDIATEYLGLTPTEREIVTGFRAEPPWEFWGLAETGNEIAVFDPQVAGGSAVASLGWLAALRWVHVLLHRSGLGYKELVELLTTRYVNPDGATRITSADPEDLTTCEIGKLVLTSADPAMLDRLHRFVRLRRRLGWSLPDLDRAVAVLGDLTAPVDTRIDDQLVVGLSHVQRLNDRLGLSVGDTLTFWASIDTDGAGSHYLRLFQNPAVLNPVDPDFALAGSALAIVTTSPQDATISTHTGTVLAALGIDAADLTVLTSTVVTDDALTVDNLSALYRHVQLARGLNLPIAESLAVQRLAGIEPFNVAHTADALRFADVVERIGATGLSVADLDHLLNHGSTDRVAGVLDDAGVARVLDQLRSGLHTIRAGTEPQPDPTGQATAAALATLGWPDDLVQRVSATLAGSVTYRADLAVLPADFAVPQELGDRVRYDADTTELTVRGPLAPSERDALRSRSDVPAFRSAVDKLFAAPRDFATQRMKAYVWPTFSADLTALPAGIAFPDGVRARIYHDASASLLRFRGVMTDAEKVVLDELSDDVAYLAAVQQLYDAPAGYTPEPSNAFLKPAEVDQLFADDTAPVTRFSRTLAELLGFLRATRSERFVIEHLAGALSVGPDVAFTLLRRGVHALSDAPQGALADFLTEPYVGSDPDVPLTAGGFPDQFGTYRRLVKAAKLVAALGLTPAQLDGLLELAPDVPQRPVPWLHGTPVASGWLDLDDLPTAPADPSAARFYGWLRVTDLVRLRDTVPGGSATVGAILAATRAPELAPDDLLREVSERTGWGLDDVSYLSSTALQLALPEDLSDETGLTRLAVCQRSLRTLGVSAQRCHRWARPKLEENDGRAALRAVKAKYPDEQWAQVAQPLRDVLRERQRAALVAYLVPRADPAVGQHWRDANGLYGHFLVDVEMSPCAMTSRLKQAISSVQLFVQRCLLNLEPAVVADERVDAGWRHWPWMKNYRVWEAARKVFLFPENWLAPELRDDKSPFFETAESALLQGDVTADSAEDVFRGYLEGLDTVARLEVAGLYEEEGSGGRSDVLHVFGRTQGTAPAYFYRRRIGGTRWTPWERVELDISDSQLLPVVWNGRLYLFWPIFGEVAEPEIPASNRPEKPKKHWHIQLAWSQYRNGAWLPKQTTDRKVWSVVPVDDKLTDHGKSKHVLRSAHTSEKLEVWYEWAEVEHADDDVHTSYGPQDAMKESRAFTFTGSDVGLRIHHKAATGVFPPTGTHVHGGRFVAVDESPGPPGKPLLLSDGSPHYDEHIALWGPPAEAFSLGYSHQDDHITGRRSFFFRDDERSYCVDPSPVVLPPWPPWVLPDRIDPAAIEAVYATYYRSAGARDAPLLIEGPRRITNDSPATEPTSSTTTGTLTVRAGRMVRNADRSMMVREGTGSTTIEHFTDEARLDAQARLVPSLRIAQRYQFLSFYHPYIAEFHERLVRRGVAGLLARHTQLISVQDFEARYHPTGMVHSDPYPAKDVDFSYTGAYAPYNWELFFHLPLLIATKLSQNQRFEEAQRWFHHIFDPTDTSDTVIPRKFWQTKPFHQQSQAEVLAQRIDELIEALTDGATDVELTAMVDAWRANPFQPHAVARLRIAAYQKAVVMRYLDNLLAWGDQLFRRDTIESINEATQLYVLAAEILGPRPVTIPPRAEPQVRTYNALAPEFEDFSDKQVDIEYLFGAVRPDAVVASPDDPPMPLPRLLYFCVPTNDTLLSYWDTVADRLFKIRHCMNIAGVERTLPLFEPPIDPGLLVRAAAAGVDIGEAITETSAPLPNYRFSVLAGKANELCANVRTLGQSLLDALARRDAEELALLQAGQENTLLATVERIREQRHDEAEQQVTVLLRARDLAATRYVHYQKLLGVQRPRVPAEGEPVPEHTPSAAATVTEESGVKMLDREANELDELESSKVWQLAAAGTESVASLSYYVPTVKTTVEPWGVGASLEIGGAHIGPSIQAIAAGLRAKAAWNDRQAARSARLASYVLREHDWSLRSNLAANEIMHIDAQLTAARIREQVAQHELGTHRKQMQHADEVEEFLRDKYTNQELYSWMVGRISAVYFQAHRLAHELAKRAERGFRFELGLSESSFVHYGSWDSLRKGLLAGESLQQDLARMEVAYLDLNEREHELTKHVSLALLHPDALVRLRETGSCFVELPEAIFDLDHAGHYLRRIRSVSVTLPCVTGPYTSVACTLTLLGNRIRRDPSSASGYRWTGLEDTRFAYDSGGIQSIVTSSGRDDAGVFDASYGDGRYLPFEGAGAISSWRIELPHEFPQFDHSTLSDVVLHMRYTARDGGNALRTAALTELTTALKTMELDENHAGLYRLLTARSEFPDAWHLFLHPTPADGAPQLTVPLGPNRFPAYLRGQHIKIQSITVLVRLAPGVGYDNDDPLTMTVQGPGGAPLKTVSLAVTEPELDGLPMDIADYDAAVAISPDEPWRIEVTAIPDALREEIEVNGQTVSRLKSEAVVDLGLLCHYTF